MTGRALARGMLPVLMTMLGLILVRCSPGCGTGMEAQGQVDAHLACIEAQIGAQGTQLASIQKHQSYIATLVWDIAGRVPSRVPVTISPTPYTTPTPTPESNGGVSAREYCPSPDGLLTAIVHEGKRLLVSDGEGERELFVAEGISGVSWFPDGRHIAMGTKINPERIQDLETQLWIIDVRDGGAKYLGAGYDPTVSPDGGHLSFLAGIPYGDACFVGYALGVSRLDENLEEVERILQDEFAGLPAQDATESFYPSTALGIPASGRWLDAEQLAVPMRWACVDERHEAGVYLLNVEARTALKLLDLP